MKKELFEEHSRKSFLAFESFVREYRETHEGALPGLKDIFDEDEGGDAAEGNEPRRHNVLQLPYVTKNNDNENDDDDDQKCGNERLEKTF